MPRRKVPFVQGAYYHFYNRGAGRQSICKSDEDYLRLLGLLKRISRECNIAIIAYCLLPNHHHWLLRQDGPDPARLLPQRVYVSYSRTFNRIHQRSGTLFEDRYNAKFIDSDVYLRQLCRYIHANPWRHGVADAPELWPYSNLQDWLGLRQGNLLDQASIETHFPDRERYRRSLVEYTANQGTEDGLGAYLRNLEGKTH